MDLKIKVKRIKNDPSPSDFLDFYKNHTIKESAKYFCISERHVSTLAKRYNGQKTKEMIKSTLARLPSRAYSIPDKKEFEHNYLNMSNDELASYYSVTDTTVNKWRKKLEINGKYVTSNNEILNNSLTEKQKSILIGSLLGDGCLTNYKSATSNSCFVEIHSLKQRDYLFWKHNELSPFSLNFREDIVLHGRVKKDKNKDLFYCRMSTRHLIFLTDLEKKWYKRDIYGNYLFYNKKRIKCLPSDLKLDELSIAVWYFDDGTVNKSSNCCVSLHTQSFTVEECKTLINHLENFGYKCSINYNRNKPVIRLSSSSSIDFLKMVEKYRPTEDIKYKTDISSYKQPNAFARANKYNIDDNKIISVFKYIKEEKSDKEISDLTGIPNGLIYAARKGKIWKKANTPLLIR